MVTQRGGKLQAISLKIIQPQYTSTMIIRVIHHPMFMDIQDSEINIIMMDMVWTPVVWMPVVWTHGRSHMVLWIAGRICPMTIAVIAFHRIVIDRYILCRGSTWVIIVTTTAVMTTGDDECPRVVIIAAIIKKDDALLVMILMNIMMTMMIIITGNTLQRKSVPDQNLIRPEITTISTEAMINLISRRMVLNRSHLLRRILGTTTA
jgi:hypothetical protein